MCLLFIVSGTAGSGATIRMYLERHVPSRSPSASATAEAAAAEAAVSVRSPVSRVLGTLAAAAVRLCRMEELTGIKEPTVIT